MIQLKNNQVTSDARLGRIPQFDSRSRQYPVQALLEHVKKLRSYTWAVPEIFNQGNEGSCTGHAFAHELIARPAMVKGIDHKFAKEKIYWRAQEIDPWPGGSYPGASPAYEGTSILAAVKATQELGYYDSYFWAFSLYEALIGIGYCGGGVAGINWREEMFYPDRNGFVKPEGDIVGGHAVYFNKISVKGKYVGFANSWGTSYGQGGFAKVTFDDFEKLLYDNGEIVFPAGRRREVANN